ncbi:hypothetical protein AAD018_012070 [Aestuariibius insulae]|uniref:hypothetical protein n=1 Tax=Aestuariibius insulae TaxID=2058287 RepID=UPI00345EEE98
MNELVNSAAAAAASGVMVKAIVPTAVRTGLSGPQTPEPCTQGAKCLEENYHLMNIGPLEPEHIALTACYPS